MSKLLGKQSIKEEGKDFINQKTSDGFTINQKVHALTAVT